MNPTPTKFLSPDRSDVSEIARQHSSASSNDYTASLLDNVPAILLILNQNRQTVFANTALIDFLGIQDIHKIIGMRPGEIVGCLHADETPGGCGTTEFCTVCGAALTIHDGQNNIHSVRECRIIQKNNSALELRVAGSPVVINDEKFVIFTLFDISNEKRRRALERIFFHDVLNTAGGIRGYAEIIASGDMDDDPEALDIISYLTNQLVEEIQAQRDLMAAESGDISISKAPFPVSQLIFELNEVFRYHPILRNRKIEFHDLTKDSLIFTDQRLVRRVLTNMIKNALEAIHDNSIVNVFFKKIFTFWVFTVHNAGMIPRQAQLQIFQRSFSTKGMDRGLGTYSIKLIGEKYLSGRVGFVSSSQGTCFYIILPDEHYKTIKDPD